LFLRYGRCPGDIPCPIEASFPRVAQITEARALLDNANSMMVVELLEILTMVFWQLGMVWMLILGKSSSRSRIAGEIAGVRVDPFVPREIPRMSLELVQFLLT
jgi:hypothetical protein